MALYFSVRDYCAMRACYSTRGESQVIIKSGIIFTIFIVSLCTYACIYILDALFVTSFFTPDVAR